jgi:hypothetical protein
MATHGARTQGDTRLLVALLEGKTLQDAATCAGISPTTAARRLRVPAFQEQLATARQEALSLAITQLTGATAQASAALIDLVAHAQQEAIRLAAARTILETSIKGLETLDVLRRLDALEARVPTQKGRGAYVGVC